MTMQQATEAMMTLVWADLTALDRALACARRDYIHGRIEVEQFEAEVTRLLPLIDRQV